MGEFKTLTRLQVAEFLQCSLRTVDRKVARKEIPAPVGRGQGQRWDYQDFYRWWESEKEAARINRQPDVPTH